MSRSTARPSREYWSLSTRPTRRSSAWPMAGGAVGRVGESVSFCLSLASLAGNRSRLLTGEYPRPRRASSWLITHAPTCSALNDGRTIPLPSAHQEQPSHAVYGIGTAVKGSGCFVICRVCTGTYDPRQALEIAA